MLWSLGKFSQGLSIFQNASHFAVNVLGASQQAHANKFAKSSEDKFVGVDWTPGLGGAPLLADSVANFQCRSAGRYYGGDHVIFLGAVEAYAYNRQEPLLFARGGYGRFLPAIAVQRRSHEQETAAQARSRQAEAAYLPTIAAGSSSPRRPNFSPTKDLAAVRAIWRAGWASPSRCCTGIFRARTI